MLASCDLQVGLCGARWQTRAQVQPLRLKNLWMTLGKSPLKRGRWYRALPSPRGPTEDKQPVLPTQPHNRAGGMLEGHTPAGKEQEKDFGDRAWQGQTAPV